MDTLLEREVELYVWNVPEERFDHGGIVMSRLVRQKNANFVYWLIASNERGILLAHRITSDMNHKFSQRVQSLTWNNLGDDGAQTSWLIRCPTAEDYDYFNEIFTKCLWESLYQSPWGKIKVRSFSELKDWGSHKFT